MTLKFYTLVGSNNVTLKINNFILPQFIIKVQFLRSFVLSEVYLFVWSDRTKTVNFKITI